MKFLVDECLHTTLVDVAHRHGHECHHVVWLGLAGASDRLLMARIVDEDFTLVTNNAVDFRRLFAAGTLHAGLVVIVPQVAPPLQRALFDTFLAALAPDDTLVNEVIEIAIDEGQATFSRYELPVAASRS